MSAGKKTARTFQCRDGLWSTFEEMAQELECSVDYLVNDAMKQYARQRGYKRDTTSQSGPAAAAPSSPTAGATPPPAPAPAAPPPKAAPSAGLAPPPLPVPAASRAHAPPPLPSAAPPAPRPPANLGKPPSAGGHPTVPMSPDRLPPLPAPSGARPPPPPLPSAAPRRPAPAPIAQKLTIHYQGKPFQVAKDRFIIGRGKTTSDLTIRDPNVSRQHALVEFSGGNFYMVDMGSTNGIEFSGQRVQRKAIQNGDVFRICDHELFCSMG